MPGNCRIAFAYSVVSYPRLRLAPHASRSIQTLEMVLAPTADRGLLPPAASMAGERRGCAFVFIAQEKAMSNIIDLGGTPANEDCAQIGHTPDRKSKRLNSSH